MIACQITSLSFHAPSGLLAAVVFNVGVQCWRTTPYTVSTSKTNATISSTATTIPTALPYSLATVRSDFASAQNSLNSTKALLSAQIAKVKPANEEKEALLLAISQLEQQCAHLFFHGISVCGRVLFSEGKEGAAENSVCC